MSAVLKNVKQVYEFDVPNIITSQVSWGRTRTVRADRMTITVDEDHGLHVLVRGRVIRRDGSEGQGYRDLGWTDDDYYPDRYVGNASQWVRDAVAEVAR